MIRRPLLAVVPAIAVAAGATAIVVDAGDAAPTPRVPPRPLLVVGCGPVPMPERPPAAHATPSAAPPEVLKAFAVLRRPAGQPDALPRELAQLLRARGIAFDPSAARLLRTDGHGADAWIVPVADAPTLAPGCEAPPVPALAPPVAPRPPRLLRRPAVPVPAPPPRALRVPARPAPARPAPAGPAPVPVPPPAAVPSLRAPGKPQPGVVVISRGGAPSGGSGTLRDLLAGRAPALVTPCAGPDHRMASISGVVPDGVDAAYLTAHDGSAVRADVKDNGFAFLVVPKRRPVQRYLVWSGRDGTPHVQPLVIPPAPGRLCRHLPAAPLVTRLVAPGVPVPALPSPPRRGH